MHILRWNGESGIKYAECSCSGLNCWSVTVGVCVVHYRRWSVVERRLCCLAITPCGRHTTAAVTTWTSCMGELSWVYSLSVMSTVSQNHLLKTAHYDFILLLPRLLLHVTWSTIISKHCVVYGIKAPTKKTTFLYMSFSPSQFSHPQPTLPLSDVSLAVWGPTYRRPPPLPRGQWMVGQPWHILMNVEPLVQYADIPPLTP